MSDRFATEPIRLKPAILKANAILRSAFHELRTHSGSCRPDRRMRPGHQARTRTVGQQPSQAVPGAYRRTHGHGLRWRRADGPFAVAATAIRPGQGAP